LGKDIEMKKRNSAIQKEVIIMLLLVILIMLILIVALYDFIPNDIVVSETISYSPDSVTTTVKQEIEYTNGGDAIADKSSSDIDEFEFGEPYQITASDLETYNEKKLYDKGNSNPFDYGDGTGQPTTGDPNEGSSGDGSSSGGSTSGGSAQNGSSPNTKATGAQTQNTSSGTFFESKNSK